jgi:CTP-dependent riboflavin kinase
LTAKETILLVIHGGTVTVSEISVSLQDLGVRFKATENEVRARLSELRKQQMVREEWKGGQVWALTDSGEMHIADVTPQLYDDELAGFGK